MDQIKKWLIDGFRDKWRLVFLIFAVAYMLFLIFGVSEMFGLSYMSIQWDEVTHLNGGALLLRGDFQTYFQNNAFYPPMYDLVTMGFFSVGSVSVFTGRLVSVVFSVLSLYALFEFAHRLYDPKTALLASIFLAFMPGYVWLSRMAMIETMLLFFFTVSAMFFFFWLQEHKDKFLILSGLALGLGVITKYQVIIVGAVMLTSLVVLGRGYLKQKLSRFPLLIIAVVAVVLPWIVVSYQVYASGMFNQWLYALNIGNPDKLLYSTGIGRFPSWYNGLPSLVQTPIFYLLEMTVPYYDPNPYRGSVHPVSLILFALSLAGLSWLAWRRKPTDKYLLIWFFVVYIFFSVIPNRQWRYVVPLFPILALSGADLFISALAKAQKTWKLPRLSINDRRLVKLIATLLIALTLTGMSFSFSDGYSWVAKDQFHLPMEEPTSYVAGRLKSGENVMVLNAFNFLSADMVQFYFNANASINTLVYQYPINPVDTYAPTFNMSELISECISRNVKYLIVDEYGQNTTYPEESFQYFGSNLTFNNFNQSLMDTGRFTYEPVYFWAEPARIFVLSFS